jgi:hypothetical protein
MMSRKETRNRQFKIQDSGWQHDTTCNLVLYFLCRKWMKLTPSYILGNFKQGLHIVQEDQ